MSSKSKRGELMLSKMGARVGISDSAQKFLITALDPFHDNPVELHGPPDGVNGNQICQLIKQTMTITCPTGITTGTWDCHIVDWPWVAQHNVNSTTCLNNVFQNSTTAAQQPFGNLAFQGTTGTHSIGGLQAYSGPTGACLSPFMCYGNLSSANFQVNTLNVAQGYVSGKHRVYAKAFEVHNTTASLYRGGSVLAYRSPVPNTEDAQTMTFYQYTGSTFNSSFAAKTLVFDGPPALSAAALLLPQSKQWGAEEGAYVVSALHDPNIGVYANEALAIYMYDTTSQSTSVTPTPTPIAYGSTANATTIPFSYVAVTPSPLPIGEFDISGTWFTGLTPQTTLTINWNVYVQRFPTNDDTDLVVLANPSCEREEAALAFYSHAVNNLPVGVPVKENGFGDWFKDVLSTASDYVAPVLSAIPHPAAQGLGMAIRGVNAVANGTTGSASQPSPYLNSGQMPQPISASKAATQISNALVRKKNQSVKEKNALIRAKNEEIRARKALKAVKKK